MSILESVSSSSARTGIRVVIAGIEGVGKTTLACNAPRALLVPLENGYAGLNVAKTPTLERFDHVLQLMDEIAAQCQAGTFPYQSLVFDSSTALERLIHQAVLERDPLYSPGNKKTVTMDSALGGYGKGYGFANELFGDFLAKADQLAIYGGVNIILTCHVFAAKVMDPTVGEYDSWDLLMHSPKNQKTYGKREMITQWADVVGFLHEPIFVVEGKTMTKGVTANKGRVLAMTRAPGYTAKNRFGVTTDITIAKDGGWNYVAAAIYESSGVDVYNRD